MRFHKSCAAFLAASISISGCSPFQRNERTADGSFRQAPTSELMAMAERYEREGEYAHAARLYEELLRGDPARSQVRGRLQALAAYGVVSPQAQGALADNLDQIVAEHQQQLAEAESERENQRYLASMTPVSTSEGYQLVDTSVARGVAQVDTPATVEPWARETFEVATEEPSTPTPDFEVSLEDTYPTPPASEAIARRSEEPARPTTTALRTDESDSSTSEPLERREAWHATVIRPQDQSHPTASASADESTEQSASRSPISRVHSSGSRLWHSASTTAGSPSSAIAGAGDSLQPEAGQLPDWASPTTTSPATEIARAQTSNRIESDWRVPSHASAGDSVAAQSTDPFYDPIVADEEPAAETTDEASSAQPIPIGAWIDTTNPLQRAQSAFTLWQVSGDASKTVPALIDLLHAGDSQTVDVACYFLGEVGPDASLAVSELRNIRDTANETTSILAAEAIAKIAPEERDSVEHIVQASHSVHNEARLLAAITLAGVDPQHESEVVPALAQLLNDENPEVRSAAALSLGGWGPAAASCTEKLEELALGDAPEVSEAARIALECIER